MLRRAAAIATLALLPLAAPAAAEETSAQKLFKQRLLADRGVAPAVKRVLRGAGFVDRRVRFADVTGDERSDALVLVHQGGSAGRIALYVFSSHRSSVSNGAGGGELRIVYKNQRLYRAQAGLKRSGPKRPHGAVVFRRPIYDPGDELADPGAVRVVELRWRPKRTRFRVAGVRVVDRVRSRHCSRTGDYCTRTFKGRGGATYLELRTASFSGRYFLCVTPPGADAPDCPRFTLRRRGDIFLSRVRWAANYPDEGRGRYRVVWRVGRQQLGRALGFRRPE